MADAAKRSRGRAVSDSRTAPDASPRQGRGGALKADWCAPASFGGNLRMSQHVGLIRDRRRAARRFRTFAGAIGYFPRQRNTRTFFATAKLAVMLSAPCATRV